MTYLYNEQSKCFAIYTNFVPKQIPEGYKEITEEEYLELTKESEQTEE